MIDQNKQRGAVSLFIVIFATLLITIVTVSFVRIAVRDQQAATTSDLSQSAYDSAQAGVEDAKRAILNYQSLCPVDTATGCAAARATLASSTCNAGLATVVAGVDDSEVMIQQNAGDAKLDQAYTCVKISLDTDNAIGTITADTSKIIPLTSTAPFNEILLEWYLSSDLKSGSSASQAVNLQPTASLDRPLYTQANWAANRPSVLRTQLMQFSSTSGFTLAGFDDSTATTPTQSNANTLFLYPVGVSGNTTIPAATGLSFSNDARKTGNGKPSDVTCVGDLTAGGYACRTVISLPEPIGSGNRQAFLRLSAYYNSTQFRLTLRNAGAPVQLQGVQPKIDSTGRANDLFRRVESRVELTAGTFPYPEAAVDITGNLCKDFSVTTDPAQYDAGTCTP